MKLPRKKLYNRLIVLILKTPWYLSRVPFSEASPRKLIESLVTKLVGSVDAAGYRTSDEFEAKFPTRKNLTFALDGTSRSWKSSSRGAKPHFRRARAIHVGFPRDRRKLTPASSKLRHGERPKSCFSPGTVRFLRFDSLAGFVFIKFSPRNLRLFAKLFRDSSARNSRQAAVLIRFLKCSSICAVFRDTWLFRQRFISIRDIWNCELRTFGVFRNSRYCTVAILFDFQSDSLWSNFRKILANLTSSWNLLGISYEIRDDTSLLFSFDFWYASL